MLFDTLSRVAERLGYEALRIQKFGPLAFRLVVSRLEDLLDDLRQLADSADHIAERRNSGRAAKGAKVRRLKRKK